MSYGEGFTALLASSAFKVGFFLWLSVLRHSHSNDLTVCGHYKANELGAAIPRLADARTMHRRSGLGFT